MTIPHSLSPDRRLVQPGSLAASCFPAMLFQFTARSAGLLGVILLASGAMAVDGAAHAESVHVVRPQGVPAAAPFADHVHEAAQRFGLPASWIRAVMAAESGGVARAISTKGAMGLMQIMPDTWADLRARHGLGINPYDPRDNIHAGAAYMREMLDRFGSPGFLAAYNAGPGRYEEYLATGRPLPQETRLYVAMLAPMMGHGQASNLIAASRQMTSWQVSPLILRGGPVNLSTAPSPSEKPAVSKSIVEVPRLVPPAKGLFVIRGSAARSR